MHEAAPLSTAAELAFAGLLVAMVLGLAFEEKIHARKSMITGIAALLALLGGAFAEILPFGLVTLPGGHQVELPVYIPAIDWGVIAIILGSSLFIDVVSRSGIFSWTAIRLTKFSRGDPLVLLTLYGTLTVVFSALLNNVTAMIIVGSLTVVSLKKLDRGDQLLGFLLVEGLLTNLGGLLTLISSVPNIILGHMAGIPFVKFFLVAAPYTAVATAVTILMGARIFGIGRLKTDAEKSAAARLVDSFDENDGLGSKRFFFVSWALLAAFIVTIATTSWLPHISELGMGFVAMAFAIIAMLRFKHSVDRNYAGLDWDLLFFFIFLFVVINVMEHAGVLGRIGGGIGALIAAGDMVGGGALLWSASIASSVTDNVPLAAVMGKILVAQDIPGSSHLWWATIFGTNLGGNFTPIGSASTVVAVAIIHRQGLKLTFASFVRQAAPFAIAQLVLATAYVLVFLR